MSSSSFDNLIDEVDDMLERLTPAQIEELKGYLDTNDLETAQFYVNVLKGKLKEQENG